MGLRFRKSIKLAKGVNLNIGKKSIGVSVGGKGARYSINSSGRRTTTIGIPNTGISYSTTSTRGKKTAKNDSRNSYSTPKQEMRTGLVPLLLTICLGWMGAHWFISGRWGMGFIYFLTFGLFGIGWIVDIIRQLVAICRMSNVSK